MNVGLFTNAAALVKGFDSSILTEATFSGYGRINVNSGWTGPTIDLNGNATYVNVLRTWTKSGAVGNSTVYGYFLVDNDGVSIYAAQLFDGGPLPMFADGDVIRLVLVICNGTPIVI